MKVKNIMFFGFAAAILSMGAANAAPNYTEVTVNDAARKIVASKAYVDAQGNKLNTDISLKQNQIAGGEGYTGKVVTASATAGAPTYTAIDTTVTNNSSNLVTSGAVYNAIPTASDFVSQTITDGVENKAPSEDAVHDALADKQDNIAGGEGYTGKVVTASATAGAPTYTAIDTTVTNNSSNLVTSGAVYNATGGNNIPAQPSACSQEGNTCALVSDEGTLKWVVMADDQHNGSVPSNN